MKADIFQDLPQLDNERIRELWSKTYNDAGKPDWSHLFPYYHDEIVFEDIIQRIEGIEEFKALCQRLTERSSQLTMKIGSILSNEKEFFFDWTMFISFGKYPNTPVYGCTHLTLAPNGQIIHQRDYYDLWGDIFNGIPYFKKPYRRFLHKKFG